MEKNTDNFDYEKKVLLAVIQAIVENCKNIRYCKDCIFDLEGDCMFYEMAPTGWDLTWLKDNIETKGV